MAIKDKLYGVPVVGTAVRVQDRYNDDAGNQLAAAMGFFGFLSLFPVLLLALSAAGFLLADDPAQQAEIVSTIEDAIPGLAAAAGGDDQTAIGEAMDSITQNPGAVGLIGLITLLFAGLRVVDSAMTATERVFHVRVQQNPVKKKLRQVGAMVGLGLLALAGTIAASSVGQLVEMLPSPASAIAVVVGPLVAVALDFVLFLVAYRTLAAGDGPAWRQLVPGALFAAVGWTALKIFGATYVANQVAKANELYGTLGGVIGLMLLLFLAGRLYVYGAELSAVLGDPGGDLAGRDPDVDPRDGSQDGEDAGDRDRQDARGQDPHGEDENQPRTQRALASIPGAGQRSPTVSTATAQRLQQADVRNRELRDPHHVRKALAFTIAVGTVGGLVYAIRPGGDDDR